MAILVFGAEFCQLLDWRYVVMWAIGGIIVFLAIKYEMEPTLLCPSASEQYL